MAILETESPPESREVFTHVAIGLDGKIIIIITTVGPPDVVGTKIPAGGNTGCVPPFPAEDT